MSRLRSVDKRHAKGRLVRVADLEPYNKLLKFFVFLAIPGPAGDAHRDAINVLLIILFKSFCLNPSRRPVSTAG